MPPPPEPLDAPLPDIIGTGPAMRDVCRATRLAAPTLANVLLVALFAILTDMLFARLERWLQPAQQLHVAGTTETERERILFAQGHGEQLALAAIERSADR